MANAVAKAYVTFANGIGQGEGASSSPGALQSQSVDLTARIQKIGSEISAATSSLAKVDPSSSSGVTLAASIASMRAEEANDISQLASVNAQLRDQFSRQGTRLLQNATPPSTPKWPRPVLYVGVGAFIGFLGGFILALVRQRRDRRVRARDEMAEIAGAPVLASLSAPRQHRTATYRNLIKGWEPTATERLALRRAMSSLGVTSNGPSESVVVVALAGDDTGQLVALQLATFAARNGIRTKFVIGSHHRDTNKLRVACHSVPGEGPGAIPNFRAYDTTNEAEKDGDLTSAELTVTLLVIESTTVEWPGRANRVVTVLAASSGFATQDRLAEAAVVCLDAGHALSGVLVANPDTGDHTIGRPTWPLSSEPDALAIGVSGHPIDASQS
jgi:hypothetical protein